MSRSGTVDYLISTVMSILQRFFMLKSCNVYIFQLVLYKYVRNL